MRKNKNDVEGKTVSYSISTIFWADCPHCKKPLVFTDIPAVKHLRKWKKVKSNMKTWKNNPMVSGEYLEGKDFNISYAYAPWEFSAFAGDTKDETAITHKGKCYILNGDHRKEYEKLITRGYRACKEYFLKHRKLKSSWSD
jgi:hypothetical protein